MASIAIVGSGFSGTLLAVHLLRRAGDATRLTLVERSGRFGPGVAYGTRHAGALLNVPAGRMSAFDADPDHFLRWARAIDPSIQGGSFVPRALYGNYLTSLLEEARHARPGILTAISDEARSLRPHEENVEIGLDSGTIRADRVALAIGNAPPGNPSIDDGMFYGSPRYTRDPWSGRGLADVALDRPVLLIGTGLTMMDVAMELRERGVINSA